MSPSKFLKIGLGSSSALIVSTVSALFGIFRELDNSTMELIHGVSQYVNFMAQGKEGSGYDVSAALFGSILYSRPHFSFLDESFRHVPLNKLIEHAAVCFFPRGPCL
jgi:phosphomevalonate kinase